MNVSELIQVLSKVDQNLPVYTTYEGVHLELEVSSIYLEPAKSEGRGFPKRVEFDAEGF